MQNTIDWNTILLALIAALPATLAAMAAFWQSVKTGKAVDGKMTEMSDLIRTDAASKATLIEKDAEAGRQTQAVRDGDTKAKAEAIALLKDKAAKFDQLQTANKLELEIKEPSGDVRTGATVENTPPPKP